MLSINIGETEYKVQYTYGVIYKTGLLEKVEESQHFFDADDTVPHMEKVRNMFEITAEILLIGLQKNHKDEFGYKTEEEKENAMDKVCDILDAFFEKDKNNGVLEVYGMLTKELMDESFLSKLTEDMEKMAKAIMETQNQAKKPTDHLKSVKK